jgi:hypothetical protein
LLGSRTAAFVFDEDPPFEIVLAARKDQMGILVTLALLILLDKFVNIEKTPICTFILASKRKKERIYPLSSKRRNILKKIQKDRLTMKNRKTQKNPIFLQSKVGICLRRKDHVRNKKIWDQFRACFNHRFSASSDSDGWQ